MAANQMFDFGGLWTLSGKASVPASPLSGSPALFGTIPGVALVDEDADGYCTLAINGVWSLSVYAHNGSAGAAINNGDSLYIDATSLVISKDTNDRFIGKAYDRTTAFGSQLIASGAVGTIGVLLSGYAEP